MLKTYHCRLSGNRDKLEFLEQQYRAIQIVARYYLFVIKKRREYRRSEIHKLTYRKIREHFPSLYSELIQHTRDKVLASVKAKKLFKVKRLVIPLIFDKQGFGLEFRKGYYNAWLRICKNNFPLEGLRPIKKIQQVFKIREIQIRKLVDETWRIYFVCEVITEDRVKGDSIFGCDINLNNISLSDNYRCKLKRFVHQKREYRKGRKVEVVNYTKNFIHTLTKKVVNYLIDMGGSHLKLENLTNIRRSSSKVEGTSKGRTLNYLLNNSFPFAMFQSVLKYKCEEVGIRVSWINPRNSSRTCSSCKSLNTIRLRQSLLECLDCKLRINADFNGAKNIQRFSPLNESLSESD